MQQLFILILNFYSSIYVVNLFYAKVIHDMEIVGVSQSL